MQRRFPLLARFWRRLSAALFAMLLLFTAAPAGAQAGQGTFVFGEGACPDPEALQAEVVRLTPSEHRQELFESVRVNVTDGGETYRVTLITTQDRQDKSFTDPNRECAKRARFAAVFIVVTLFPPELDLAPQGEADTTPSEGTDLEPDEPGPSEPTREPAPPPKPAPVQERLPPPEADQSEEPPFDPIARIELAVEAQLAPSVGDGVGVNKLGPSVLAVLGRGSLLLTLGVGYTLPTDFDAGLVHARMSELPARIGLRLPFGKGELSWALDLSATGALRRVQGRGAVVPNQASHLGLGARADLGVFYGVSQRIRLLGGVHTTFEPAPAELRALPYGRLGTMPWLWLGARLGVGVAL